MKLAGRALTPVAPRLPIGPRAVALVSHSGFMLPVADPALAAKAIKEFLTTPVDWYFHLALQHLPARPGLAEQVAGAGARSSPAPTTCSPAPATWPARPRASSRATYVELPGSHFIAARAARARCTRCCSSFLERVG